MNFTCELLVTFTITDLSYTHIYSFKINVSLDNTLVFKFRKFVNCLYNVTTITAITLLGKKDALRLGWLFL